MSYSVCKFGGSSLASAELFEETRRIIDSDKSRKYIVVSAPGKSKEYKYKVTDLLFNVARDGNHKVDGIKMELNRGESAAEIISIYTKIMTDMGLTPEMREPIIDGLKKDFSKTFSDQDKKEAYFASRGEHYSARLMHLYLNHKGMKASLALPEDCGLLLTGHPTNAAFDVSCADYVKAKLSALPGIIVVPGYYALLKDGTVAVLPRSGSDISQTFVAHAVNASRCENFTDVDGIARANPKIVPEASQIKEICFDETRELAHLDSKVPAAALPHLIPHRIPFYVKSTKNPNGDGTIVCSDRMVPAEERIAGVSSKKKYAVINISRLLLNEDLGVDAEISRTFSDLGILIEHIPSGIDTLSVVFEKKYIEKPGLLNELERRLQEKVPGADIIMKEEMAQVVVAGRGMRNHHDVASRTLSALAKEKIKPLMLNMGASDISFFIAVHENSADEAVRAIYKEFF
ncbi:MAG: aspartate kinase [Fibrobacteres bacterium]|nr:aspartate kinase [Fibrobacterota bacterium]